MIGIFDSGSGGLTVLKAIRDRLPSADILYYGDIKNAPYGEKSREEISHLTAVAIKRLQDGGATSIVSACNSVSASLAISLYDVLGLSQHDLIEMVGPTVSVFRGYSKPLLVLATPTTVRAGLYQEAFRMIGLSVDAVAIPGLAGAIEFGSPENEQEELIRKSCADVDRAKYGAVILACTHYPLILPLFQKVLGDVPIFDPAEAVADRVKKVLWPREVGEGTIRCELTAHSLLFKTFLTRLLPNSPYTLEVLE